MSKRLNMFRNYTSMFKMKNKGSFRAKNKKIWEKLKSKTDSKNYSIKVKCKKSEKMKNGNK